MTWPLFTSPYSDRCICNFHTISHSIELYIHFYLKSPFPPPPFSMMWLKIMCPLWFIFKIFVVLSRQLYLSRLLFLLPSHCPYSNIASSKQQTQCLLYKSEHMQCVLPGVPYTPFVCSTNKGRNQFELVYVVRL